MESDSESESSSSDSHSGQINFNPPHSESLLHIMEENSNEFSMASEQYMMDVNSEELDEIIVNADSDDETDIDEAEIENTSSNIPSEADQYENFVEMNEVASTPIPATPVTWDWKSVTTYESNVVEFNSNDSGWQFSQTDVTNELKAFKMTLPLAALQHCISESNRYARDFIQQTMTTKGSISRRMSSFQDINQNEFLKFLTIRIIMGINRKPEQEQYWSKDPLMKCDVIPKLLTSDRYFEIMRYLHLCNNNEQIQGDRLGKIRSVWEMCVSNFKKKLIPSKNVCVDESLVLFKGRLYFKQFNPCKRSRFGIKTFSLVDCKTGFILDSIIYSGKGHKYRYSTKDFGYGGAVVMELMTDYLRKGHVVYTDNWFSSPNLASELILVNTYLCSTVQRRRQNMPKVEKLNKGEIVAFTSNNILVEHWRDKKIVSMISTSHDLGKTEVKPRNSAELKVRPNTVLEYNLHAGGVDQSDMLMKYYSIMRRSMKWYKKLYFHLIDVCLFNAYKIFSSVNRKIPYLNFRLNLIQQLIDYTGSIDLNKAQAAAPHHPLRLSLPGKHFLDKNPATKGRKTGSRKCVVCSKNKNTAVKKSHSTSYYCKICKVPLCAVPCFEVYHSKKVY